jgi:REP element-mobilizing transposase RayT
MRGTTPLGQVELVFNKRGGRREGAGRKRRGRKRVSHASRPDFPSRFPTHITMRFLDGLPTMRRRKAFKVIRATMFKVMEKHAEFRIVHLTIQGNHVHMVCEASGKTALARGVQGFKISAGKCLNKMLGREGKLWADRYHSELLTTPTQVRNAICYVLNNWRRHGVDRGATVRVDHFSTGYFFHGWKERGPIEHVPDGYELLPSARPRTWLLKDGWKRGGGAISLYERPGPRPDVRA